MYHSGVFKGTEQEKEVFTPLTDYFKQMFIVSGALSMALQGRHQESDYISNLVDTLRKHTRYLDEITTIYFRAVGKAVLQSTGPQLMSGQSFIILYSNPKGQF